MIKKYRIEFFIVGSVLLIALPGALMGTGFLREDWVEIERLRTCGFVECPGPEIGNRPVMSLLWNIPFGWFDQHPGVNYWLLNLLLATTGVATHRTLRVHASQLQSLAIVLVWAIVPTHLALQHWPSVMHNSFSLTLFALGMARFVRKPGIVAVVLFAASIAVYESTALLVILALLTGPVICHSAVSERARSSRFRNISLLVIGGLTAVILALQLGSRSSDYLNPLEVFWANFTMGSTGPLYVLLGVCTLIFVVIAVARISNGSKRAMVRTSDSSAEWLVVVGLVIMLVGALPFASSDFDTMFFGLGDRANQTASIGAAMVLVGALTMFADRRVLYAGLTVLLVLALPLRLERERDYAYVVTTTPKLVAEILATAAPGEKTITVPPIVDDRYAKLSTNAQQEVRLALLADHGIRLAEPPERRR